MYLAVDGNRLICVITSCKTIQIRYANLTTLRLNYCVFRFVNRVFSKNNAKSKYLFKINEFYLLA